MLIDNVITAIDFLTKKIYNYYNISTLLSNERRKGTEMKKIISLLVALTLVFALTSCGGSELDKFIDIFENSEPTITTTYVTQENKTVTLQSSWVTTVYGEDFKTEYTWQVPQIPEPGMNEDEYLKTETQELLYHKGQFSVDGGKTWTSEMPDSVTESVKFDLAAADIDEYEISNGDKRLVTVLTAEQAEALLGIDVNANEDGVNLAIEHDGANLRKINISYVTENKTTVTIMTSYTYDAVTSPFETEEEPTQE